MNRLRRSVMVALAGILAAGIPAQAQQDKLVVILFGPPAAGKSTHAENIKRDYGIPIVSLAELLRKHGGAGKAASKEFKQLNKQIKAGVESGDLVTDDTADRLVRERIMRNDAGRGFVLDGYPSNRAQVENLEGMLKDFALPPPVVIHLDVPDAVVMSRAASRGREDDKAGFTEDRLKRFREEEAAILPLYPKLRRVDGSRSVSEVWMDVKNAIELGRNR